VKPLIPWVGGKTRIVKEILRRIPIHTCYVEVFFGGGSVFFAKPPSRCEVVNDINAELVNLYRVVQQRPWTLLAEMEWELVSRGRFDDCKAQNVAALTPVERAARFYYLVKNAFCARMSRTPDFGTSATRPPHYNPFTVARDVGLAWVRLARVTVERKDFRDLIPRYDRPETFFYLDPPYVEKPGCYTDDFTEVDHRDLAKELTAVEGKWLLSYNDAPLIRDLYKDFKVDAIQTRYTLGQISGKWRSARELLIRNYPLTSKARRN